MSKRVLRKIGIILVISSVVICSLWTFLLFFLGIADFYGIWIQIKPVGWITFLVLLIAVNTLLSNYFLKIKNWREVLWVLGPSALFAILSLVFIGGFHLLSLDWRIDRLHIIRIILISFIPLFITLGGLFSLFIRKILPLNRSRAFLIGFTVGFISCSFVFALLEYKFYMGHKKIFNNLNNPSVLVELVRDDWFIRNRIETIWQLAKFGAKKNEEAISILTELSKDDDPIIQHISKEALKMVNKEE